MEVSVPPAVPIGTGSKTIADLLPLAAEQYGEQAALRHKVGDEWVDISYAELGTVAREIALGLVDLGLRPGDKVSICAHTRPEWTEACFGILTAGGVLVTIYQTNSAEECQYVLAHSDSRMVFVEDGEQLAKIRSVEARLPAARADRSSSTRATRELGDALSLDDAARARPRAATPSEWEARYSAVTPDDLCVYIYTSGTTGPPKGCLLTHRNYRTIVSSTVAESVLEDGDSCYLFLPLAHAFAVLIQFVAARPRRDARLLVARPAEDHRRADGGQPDLLPVGAADVREDLHARDHERARQGAAAAGRRASASRCASCRTRASRSRSELQAGLRQGRGGAVQERPRAVRLQHQGVRDRRGADRRGDPALLLRLRRAGDGGLRHDRDGHRRHRQPRPRRAASASARSASRSTASRCGSPTTARC